MSNRAVSEVLGFILIFALITTTVGIVYVTGVDGLSDRRDAERVNNAERAFDVLADNLQDLRQQGAPSRATEIKLADARLSFGGETQMKVVVTSTTPDRVYTADIDPIVYSSNTDTEIVYEGGAVIRVDGDSAILKRKPGMVFTYDVESGRTTAIIPFVQTRAQGGRSIGGSTTTLIRTRQADSELLTPPSSGPYSIRYTIETTPERAEVWKGYLDGQMTESEWNKNCELKTTDEPDDTVECTLDVDRLYIPVTRIDVTFS